MSTLSAPEMVEAERARVAARFLGKGQGAEVGAGSRPFPVPVNCDVFFGDVRDADALKMYFSTAVVSAGVFLDAQTFEGVPDRSFDFVISAHVIEHLRDPIGSIVQTLRVLKRGGIFILVVPNRIHTFDQLRPNTTVEHSIADVMDGGESTTVQAYEEHCRYVHPYLTGETHNEAEIARQSEECAANWREFDVHFHAWDLEAFEAMLDAAKGFAPFRILHRTSVVNENIFVIKKPFWRW